MGARGAISASTIRQFRRPITGFRSIPPNESRLFRRSGAFELGDHCDVAMIEARRFWQVLVGLRQRSGAEWMFFRGR
jgi:hypothetical protein